MIKLSYGKEIDQAMTCFDIADYFIWLANESGSFISNLKLQKLVYYAQAWHLALYDQPLFDEDFEAWIHGPVIPVLYQQYKSFGRKPIDKDVREKDIEFPSNINEFLEQLSNEYFHCDARELELMSHLEDPWLLARNGLDKDISCSTIISKDSMKKYYKACVEESH